MIKHTTDCLSVFDNFVGLAPNEERFCCGYYCWSNELRKVPFFTKSVNRYQVNVSPYFSASCSGKHGNKSKYSLIYFKKIPFCKIFRKTLVLESVYETVTGCRLIRRRQHKFFFL